MRLSSAFALLSAWQTCWGAVEPHLSLRRRATGSIDSFIASESPVALQGILNNIGSAGSKVAGAASGIVVASPSKTNPDCEMPVVYVLKALKH